MPSWVVIRTFSSRMEAEIARGALEANGVTCRINSDDLAGLRPHLALSSGVQLLVAEADVEAANQLLELL